MSSPPAQLQAVGRVATGGAVALLGVHVARTLHGRWRRLARRERERLQPLAEEVRERALDLRGERDVAAAQRDLDRANSRLADALVDTASDDPEVSEQEVSDLREELARELARLASGEPAEPARREPAPAGDRAAEAKRG